MRVAGRLFSRYLALLLLTLAIFQLRKAALKPLPEKLSFIPKSKVANTIKLNHPLAQTCYPKEAFVTLLDSASPFALKCASALIATLDSLHYDKRDIIALSSDTSLSPKLVSLGFKVQPIPRSKFSIINVWNMTSYDRVLYIDPCTVILKPLDYLFNTSETLVAPRLMFPSDWFSSSFMLVAPDSKVFSRLSESQHVSPDDSQHGFLNVNIKEWKTMPVRAYQSVFGVPEKYIKISGKQVEIMRSGALDSFGYVDTETGPWPRSARKRIRALLGSLKFINQPERKTCSTVLIRNSTQRLQQKVKPHRSERVAVVTFLQDSSQNFINAASVLAKSLFKQVGSRYPLIIMVNDSVNQTIRWKLESFGYIIQEINRIAHPVPSCRLSKWGDRHSGNSEIGKLSVWKLIEFDKVVYLDVDTLVLGDIGELFTRPGTPISASHGMFASFLTIDTLPGNSTQG